MIIPSRTWKKTSWHCNKNCVYIPRNMHTVFALLCFVVVIHWLIFPYPSGLLHWHCGNLMIAPVPAKKPWWIWINTSCEIIMNDCITTTKQSTTKRVHISWDILYIDGLAPTGSKTSANTVVTTLWTPYTCHYSEVTWASWRLKSPITQLFVEHLV